MKRLNGNVTLITGGGKGIGYGLAEAFAEQGSNLVITGRTESRLVAAKEKLEQAYGIEVLPIVADGADEEAIKNVVAKTIERFGKINTLVNNAQVSKSGTPLVEHTKEDFDLAIYSGLYAAFFYMRECFPYLKESKGSVINFASGAGLFGKLGQSSYAAAKEGIRGMSRVAAAEWGPDGIRVNVICPLAMTESLQDWKEHFPELFEKTIQGIPLGRLSSSCRSRHQHKIQQRTDQKAAILGGSSEVQHQAGHQGFNTQDTSGNHATDCPDHPVRQRHTCCHN